MERLDVKYYPEKDYRELFDVAVDSNKCIVELTGITNSGDFLYIIEKLANYSSAYYMDREFFSIDKNEFRSFLEKAMANGEAEKAIINGHTTREELERLTK